MHSPPRKSRIPCLGLALATVVMAGGHDAHAWTPDMDETIALQAERLMPPALRFVLIKHRDSLRAGARERDGAETDPSHVALPGRPGVVIRIRSLVGGIIEMIDKREPFSDVAREMGRLAHFVGDLNNPLQVSDDDPREAQYVGEYLAYVERNLEKYPLVFYGWEDVDLARDEIRRGERIAAFSEATAERARSYYAHISAAYSPENRTPMAQRFDIRSIPFGIGSLSYSHSVTDTAKLWLFIWREANGDLRGTPHLSGAGDATAGARP